MSKKIFVLLLVFIGLLQTCNTTEPQLLPPDDNAVKSDIELTSPWTDLYRIALKWNKSPLDITPNTFTYELKRVDEIGNEITKTFTITGSDTTYVDGNEGDSLETGKNYTYKVFAYSSAGKLRDTSKTVIEKTLTATSHDIIWQIDTLGEPGNVLRDVWGIDENNVWAVGGITLPEGGSTVIRWDGEKWLPVNPYPIAASSIFGFSENDIWVSGGLTYGYTAHWNGAGWEEYSFYPPGADAVWGLNAVWGSAPDDVWAVGNQGTIIHWDGVEWKKRNEISDELIIFYDIWGSSANNIYAITGSLTNRSQLWHYDGNLWTNVSDNIPGLKKNLYSLWIDKNNTGFIGGNTILKLNNDFIEEANIALQKVIMIVRGMNSADIIFGGQRGTVFHYNGTDFKEYPELRAYEGPLSEILGAQVFTNKIFLVGYSDKALVYIGTK